MVWPREWVWQKRRGELRPVVLRHSQVQIPRKDREWGVAVAVRMSGNIVVQKIKHCFNKVGGKWSLIIELYLWCQSIPKDYILLTVPHLSYSMWESSFLTRNQTPGPLHWECGVLITGPQGRSQTELELIHLICTKTLQRGYFFHMTHDEIGPDLQCQMLLQDLWQDSCLCSKWEVSPTWREVSVGWNVG